METQSTNVVEMVSFKLYDYIKEEELINANESMGAFLAAQPGFLYRSLTMNPQTQEWTDIVYWEDMAKAEAAGKAFMESEHTKAMVRLIDNQTIKVQHLPVKWMYYPEMQRDAS